ncbi:hypothetical protein [Pseudoduganella sp. GCM10020061]|uniref:hypothetical protein n=1 Tax=Pseudoduganella sp. GCM10020061 TaxID=3317345 RepID=UPI003641682C
METDKDILVHYATKEDLQGVRVEMQALRVEVQEVRGQVAALRMEMLAIEARLRADLHKLSADLFSALHAQTWRMVGLVLTVNIATVTAVYYIAH